MEMQSGLCCGLLEVNGLSNYEGKDASERALKDLASDMTCDSKPVPFIIFTSASSKRATARYAENFKNLIEKLKLGYVTQSDPRLSHTGNYVTVYVWHVDRERFLTYIQKNNND